MIESESLNIEEQSLIEYKLSQISNSKITSKKS